MSIFTESKTYTLDEFADYLRRVRDRFGGDLSVCVRMIENAEFDSFDHDETALVLIVEEKKFIIRFN